MKTKITNISLFIVLFVLTILFNGFVLNRPSNYNNEDVSVAYIDTFKKTNLRQLFNNLQCEKTSRANLTAKSGNVTIGTHRKYAGAIDTLRINSSGNFVNNYDHGRQIQYAITTGNGECYNPTEAGSASDGSGNTSSSQFVEGCQVSDSKIYTKNRMAFWLSPGTKGFACNTENAVNTSKVSDFYLSKIIETGFDNNPNLTRIVAKVDVPHKLNTMAIEVPTGYLHRGFTRLYSINKNNLSRKNYDPNKSNTSLFGFRYIQNLKQSIPIASNGSRALAVFTVGSTYSTLYAYKPSGDENETIKWNEVIDLKNVEKGSYYFETFMLTGTQKYVLDNINEIFQKYKNGYVEGSSTTGGTTGNNSGTGGNTNTAGSGTTGTGSNTGAGTAGVSTDGNQKKTCANLDIDNNRSINLVDFANFVKDYRQPCEQPSLPAQCGSTDINKDGVVNLSDFAVFSNIYLTDNCVQSLSN